MTTTVREWTIRVCPHGYRVEYNNTGGGWLHMDGDRRFCDAPTDDHEVLQVIPANPAER